jgi:hypothetical protein
LLLGTSATPPLRDGDRVTSREQVIIMENTPVNPPGPAAQQLDPEREARRAFLMKLGSLSVAAPTATLLLAVAAKEAFAHGSTLYGCPGGQVRSLASVDSDGSSDSDSDRDSNCDSDGDSDTDRGSDTDRDTEKDSETDSGKDSEKDSEDSDRRSPIIRWW